MAVPVGRLEDSDDDGGGVFDEVILENQADAGLYLSETPTRLSTLASASCSGDVNALRVALENFDGSIDDPVEDGDTVLHLTCLYGYLKSVQLLLERGANLEAKDKNGGLPLHDACIGGHSDIVDEIINHVNDPERLKRMLETVDGNGDTPLHYAARGECVYVIRSLLAHGASLTATNVDGKTPTELAEPGSDARRLLEMASGSSSQS